MTKTKPLKIPTEALRGAFDFVSKAAAASSPLEITRCVRLLGQSGRLTLACNNLTTYAEARIECDAEMALCIRADRMGLALNAAGDEINLSVDHDMLAWKSGSSRYRIATRPVEDFPVPSRDGEPILTVNDGALVEHAKRVAYACGSKDFRAWAHGVFVEAIKGEITVTATDGHKLATSAVGAAEKAVSMQMIVPRDSVSILPDGVLGARLYKGRVEFDYGSALVICNNIDAQPPDWRRAVTTRKSFKLRVGRKALLTTVRAITPFDTAAAVNLTRKDGAALRVVGEDRGESGEIEIPATGKGDVDLWFSSGLLIPTLNALSEDEIDLEFFADDSRLSVQEGGFRATAMGLRR
jgi:DNA polymerase-3 subunit beta